MDGQMKRGLLEACVLTLLSRGESYGYQLIRDLGPVMAISESTLYPVLRRLEAAGWLTVCSREHNGRLRKYYNITPAGAARIDAFLTEWEEVDRVYRFILEEKNHEQ